MGRRKYDRLWFRVVVGLAVLNALTGTLAAILGARALLAINDFNDFMGEVKAVHERRVPKDF